MKEDNKKEPDYKGFGEHVLDYEQAGIPYGTKELTVLAKKYNCPIPHVVEGELIFDVQRLLP